MSATRLMSQNDHPRLSLLAQYDDIIRSTRQVTAGIEDEFIIFAKSQNEMRIKWCNTLKDIENIRAQLIRTKNERDIFETKWKHARTLIDVEMQRRHKVEKEKKSLERQIALIKEVLLSDQNALNDQTKEKLAFLSTNTQKCSQEASPRRLETIEESMGSLLSPSDVSFDKTDDDLDSDIYPSLHQTLRRSKSKRNRLDNQKEKDRNHAKKPKLQGDSSEEQESSNPSAVELQNNHENHECVSVPVTRSKRCFSEPVPSISEILPPPRPTCKSDNDPFDDGILFTDEHGNPLYTRLSGSTPHRFSSAGKINRAHVFCTKTVIRPETCYPCGRRIKFYKQALKCQDCRATCHPECREKVPLPCYPTMQTPTGKGSAGTIADYSPQSSPMIPSLIVHCVNEIESRGLNEIGLYRVSGSEREVKDLKEKFLKGKCVPCLSKIDIHAICGTVKEFLRSLHEPLITRSLWRDFVCASEMQVENDQFAAIFQAISQLPQPNRDTLAFLILHLNSVAESPKCKMPIENLAKVFGPTVVGYSVAEPLDAEMLIETKYQCAVMHVLLKIPVDYWKKFVCLEADIPSTPEPRPAPMGNRLGPLTACGTASYKSRGVTLGKTPLTPRGNVTGTSKTKRQFFASPLLK